MLHARVCWCGNRWTVTVPSESARGTSIALSRAVSLPATRARSTGGVLEALPNPLAGGVEYRAVELAHQQATCQRCSNCAGHATMCLLVAAAFKAAKGQIESDAGDDRYVCTRYVHCIEGGDQQGCERSPIDWWCTGGSVAAVGGDVYVPPGRTDDAPAEPQEDRRGGASTGGCVRRGRQRASCRARRNRLLGRSRLHRSRLLHAFTSRQS
jgi:hypothetical protein